MRSFKRTLWKAAAFLLSVFVISEIIVEPYFQNEVYHYQDAAVRDSMAGTLDFLICGSSQSYRGIVPQVLDEKLGCNSYNLSTSRMTMAGRYELLKKELNRNPVKTVIIDLSYNTLTRDRAEEGPEGDLYQLGRYPNLFERMGYFFRHFQLNEYARTYYDTMNRGIKSWDHLLRGEGLRGSSGKYQNKGWQAGECNPIPPLERGEKHTKQLPTEALPENLSYLNKILRLCKEKNIQVILVTLPIPERITLQYNTDGFDSIYSNYKTISQTWGIPFYDFNLLQGKTKRFADETAFYDEYHMSLEGGWSFTDFLADVLLRAQAGEDVSGLFYDSYAQAEAGEAA